MCVCVCVCVCVCGYETTVTHVNSFTHHAKVSLMLDSPCDNFANLYWYHTSALVELLAELSSTRSKRTKHNDPWDCRWCASGTIRDKQTRPKESERAKWVVV